MSREAIEGVSVAESSNLYLVGLEGPDAGQWIELRTEPLAGGRDGHLALVLSDSQVSRLHLLVTAESGVVMVEDLGSTNGTYVDGQRIVNRAPLPVGSLLRVGDDVFRCERCSRRDMQRAVEQHRDLERAAKYVLSLLPPPLDAGPVLTDWLFQPSARLGGDAFGYEALDEYTYLIYLFDVSGHGVGAAMHSISVLNAVRQRALSVTELRTPALVLSRLNMMFPMERHNDQYFTMWYAVYDTRRRSLTYASGGHHPAFLVTPDKRHATPLRTSGSVIGACADAAFRGAEAAIPERSSLYLFSDGVFEILARERQWCLSDFVPLILQPTLPGESECRRLRGAVRAARISNRDDDDFSLLVVTFP
jgi:hypothetical protein